MLVATPSLQTRHDLCVAFAGFEASHVMGVTPVDKDPQEYLDSHAGVDE